MTDIVKESFKAVDINAEFEIYPVSRIIWSIENQVNVASIGSKSWFANSEKSNPKLFSQIHFTNLHLFYLKNKFPNGFEYSNLDNLQKYLIGYVRGGAFTDLINKHKLNIVYGSSIEANVHQLINKRTDFFVATYLAGWASVEEYSEIDLKQIAAVPKPVDSITGEIFFSNDQDNLLKSFNTGFSIIKQNGTHKAILKKYYKDQPIPEGLLTVGG